MATRTLIAALLTSALAAACAATDEPLLTAAQDADMVRAAQAARKCTKLDNRDDCSITVTVRDSASGCALSMEADQETIAFPRGVRDKVIFWRLDDQTGRGGFIFTHDGIAIDGNAAHDFDRADRFDQGKGFQWRNRNPRAKEFYYAVHVKNKASAVTCDLDPRIRNEN
ncbi:MAG TPA: hypothetical protein PLG77_06955 [Burkholderiaceae bacterium]|nr:hypothetical protein [Burkholderiaceae bacterium]